MKERRLLLILLCGCSAQPATSGAFNRTAMLTDVTTYVILPNYADFTAKAQALADGVKTDSAAAAQAKWNAAYVAFKHTETHGFGPAADLSLSDAIGAWPTAPAAMLDADAETVTAADQVTSLAVSHKGLAALEYVLWDGRFEQRRAYASALAEATATAGKTLEDAWRNGHADAFDNGSDPYRSVKQSIDAAYNRLIATADAVAVTRLSEPLGSSSGGTIQPDKVESPYSGLSAAHALATLTGMESLYLGVDGHQGMGAIVLARDAALHQRVLDTFTAAKAALVALHDPLAALLSSDPASVKAAADAVRAIRDLLNTEVANAIGVTVTYSDTDGD